MLKHHVDTLLPEAEVQARIQALAKEISTHYAESDGLVLVGLLRGSFIFLADLSRALSVGHEVDFMIASSYGNDMHSSREVRIHKDIEGELHHKDVLIVEDIIDTGYTLAKVREIITLRSPRSLRICTLLDKPSRREAQVPVDWVGFAIPDEFVVGMGIDYAQQYRHLPYIGKVVLEE